MGNGLQTQPCRQKSCLQLYTGCAKKKKDILNIHIKSEGINIFFTKILLGRFYHICGQMSKVHTYSPIIYDIGLFQALKRNYAVNGHEMYCTCVFFYLCVAHILTQSQSYQTVKGFMTKCIGFYIIIVLYSI